MGKQQIKHSAIKVLATLLLSSGYLLIGDKIYAQEIDENISQNENNDLDRIEEREISQDTVRETKIKEDYDNGVDDDIIDSKESTHEKDTIIVQSESTHSMEDDGLNSANLDTTNNSSQNEEEFNPVSTITEEEINEIITVRRSRSKRSLNNFQREFLNKIKPGAIAGWHKYKILPSITAAQGILESGWGRSDLATIGNNLFGVKGSYQGNTINMNTREETPTGKDYYINAGFRLYPSWAASIEDHGKFLNENSRYRKLIGETDYRTVAHLLQRAGYATAGNYASSLIGLIESNKLSLWDQEAFSGRKLSPTVSSTLSGNSSKQVYTVVSGDSLWGIANKNGITLDQLLQWNNLNRNSIIHPGDNLFVSSTKNNVVSSATSHTPTPSSNKQPTTKGKTYTVVSGDSLWGIANKNGITLDQLLQWNNLNRNSIIHPGDNLIVSSTKNNVVSSTTSHTSTASSNKQPTTKGKTYTVVSGDSLWGIANKNGITLDQLLQWNNLNRNSIIHPGDNLFVSSTKNNVVSSATSHTPTPSSNKQPTTKGKTYTVVSGDSLWGIANKNGITLDQLLQWNNLNKNSIIHPGDTLLINK